MGRFDQSVKNKGWMSAHLIWVVMSHPCEQQGIELAISTHWTEIGVVQERVTYLTTVVERCPQASHWGLRIASLGDQGLGLGVDGVGAPGVG